ncbi:MAG: diacylglycerol kinase family lipid kinase [Acidobacteria bacterium]|nr:diacylglycerol kinase family lipid kinase [Acidobacteriota bacterium]MCW5967025.1 diacylglycerol kinase family lipid kinase [Blastocatellales bacterium]
MTRPYLAVVNPAAGFGKCGQLVGPALDRLKAAGLDIDVVETKHAGHGVEIARNAYREGYRRFIAVGGDGTSFEIINGVYPEALDGETPTLGFLPLGTGNSFLRDFTEQGVEYATHALIEGRSRPCDVVRLKHRDGELYYINILSLGFVADVCTMANRRFKRLGESGYFLAVVLCLARFQQRTFKLRLDGSPDPVTHRTALLIFNNSKFTGGHMMLAPDARTDDGVVEIVRWSAGRFDFIWNFRKCYDGTHITHPEIWHGPARQIDFDFTEPIDIMVDGEVMTLHCESLEVLPAALNVVV